MSHLPAYYRHLVVDRGMTLDQATERVALVQNAFSSARARKWFFANLARIGGSGRKEKKKRKRRDPVSALAGPFIRAAELTADWVMEDGTPSLKTHWTDRRRLSDLNNIEVLLKRYHS